MELELMESSWSLSAVQGVLCSGGRKTGIFSLFWVFTFDQIQIMGECDTQSLDLGHVRLGSCDRLNGGLNLKYMNYSAVTFHSESRLLRAVIHHQTLFLWVRNSHSFELTVVWLTNTAHATWYRSIVFWDNWVKRELFPWNMKAMFLVNLLSCFSVVICVFGSLPNFPKHHL